MTEPDARATFDSLPDLAGRLHGGSVVAANDEFFAEKENLIQPEPPVFKPATFTHKGQLYDGWETRRRRDPGNDWAIVRLGLPGVVRGVLVDTAHFTGNYPQYCSVEGFAVTGYPGPDELSHAGADWVPLVPRQTLAGDAVHRFPVNVDDRFTHVRLSIYPDGGVARFRVHGEVVPDPRNLLDVLDLGALENGGQIAACSNMFYSPPYQLIAPGLARAMGEGWETARRRDPGNDWVTVRLAAAGHVRQAELDTSHFKGNAPGWAALHAFDSSVSGPDAPQAWFELLPRTRLQPDTRHRIRLSGSPAVTHVRLDVYPDGGMARLRLYGDLTAAGRGELLMRWFNRMPESQLRQVLGEAGIRGDEAGRALAARPVHDVADLPERVRVNGMA